MDCKKYKALIGRLIDGRLNEEDRRHVEGHLKICHHCTTYFQNLQMLGRTAKKLELSGEEEYWTKQKDAVMEKIDKVKTLQNKIVKAPSKQYRDYVYRSVKSRIYKLTAIAASIALVAFISIYESREFKNNGPALLPQKINQPIPESTQVKDMERASQKSGEIQMGQRDESKKPESQENAPVQKALSIREPKIIPPPYPASIIESNEPNTTRVGIKPAVEEKTGSVHDKYEASGKVIISREQAFSPQAKAQLDRRVMADKEKIQLVPLSASIVQGLEDSLRAKGDIQLNMAESKSERVDSLEIYMRWRRKLEYLEARYADILSPHYRESTAKSRREISEDSLSAIICELAEAYYNTGFYSADKIEKKAMLDKLREMAQKGDSETAKLIQNYIDRLEPSIK